VRVKSKWHKKDKTHTIEELAGVFAFIAIRIAQNGTLNLENNDFQTDTAAQRLEIMTEYLCFTVHMIDRMTIEKFDENERQRFMTELSLKCAKHIEDNKRDLIGPGDYRQDCERAPAHGQGTRRTDTRRGPECPGPCRGPPGPGGQGAFGRAPRSVVRSAGRGLPGAGAVPLGVDVFDLAAWNWAQHRARSHTAERADAHPGYRRYSRSTGSDRHTRGPDRSRTVDRASPRWLPDGSRAPRCGRNETQRNCRETRNLGWSDKKPVIQGPQDTPRAARKIKERLI